MESSPNLETKMQIPSNQIYKAFILDDEGKVNRVHIFCANTKDKSSIHSLFSDLELAYFEKENVEAGFIWDPSSGIGVLLPSYVLYCLFGVVDCWTY